LESSIAGRSIANRTPFLVRDTTREPDVYRELVERVGARSFVIVPLLSGREAIGTITVANKQSATLGPEDERVLTMLASGAVIALENARLFARLEQRTLELEALYRADEELYTKLRLQDLLNTLVEVAVDILRADKSSLMVYNPDSGQLEVRAAHGFRPETLAQMTFAAEEGAVTLAASRRDIVVVEDTRREERIATRITEAENILSLMHAPIEVGERLFGVFNVSYESPRNFTEEEQRLFSALAQRAALAIENVQLQERAQEAAAAEERNRLARELHDAVTQTLFSASLIADVLPRLWEKNQAQGRERLEELRELTRGALAEMRTLLLELRPATLTEVGLNDLLRQLVEAIVGRARLPIELVVEGEELLPADVQVAFYRIAQESLNNIAKHAEAKHVHVHLRYGSGVVELRISDDGRGFDPGDVGLSSLGLRIMRERAEQIGADLHIETGPGEGTTVHVGWANANGSHNPMEHGRARAWR
jgi:signal transduction histidine kinase